MAFEIRCTSCDTVLSVPDDMAGKKVRCQSCSAVLTAERDVEEIAVEMVEGPPPARAAVVQPGAPVNLEVNEEPEDSPRRRPLEDDDEEEMDDRPRRRRRKRQRRYSPSSQVQAPAFALWIVGWVGVVLNVLFIIVNLIRFIVETTHLPRGTTAPAGFYLGALVGIVIQLGVTVFWCGAIIKGADNMLSFGSYSLAITGCIVAMLPCSCAWLGGLPIGIWCMIVLLREDVQKAYR